MVLLIVGGIFYGTYLQNTVTRHDKLVIGIGTWPGFAIGMVGQEKGLFDGIDVEFKILDDPSARHIAFQSGAIDIMVSSADVYVGEAARDIKGNGKIILVTDESSGSDGIVAGAAIKTPADLKGKKIAFVQATPSQFLLYKVLQKHGLSLADIQQVKVSDPSDAAKAFTSGSVDAAVTFEPFLTEASAQGKGHVLLTTKDYPGTVVDVLVASDKVSNNSDLLKRFIEGWYRSVNYTKDHQGLAAVIIAKGLKIQYEDVEEMMAGLNLADLTRNKEFFNNEDPGKTSIAALLGDAGGFWKSQGFISQERPAGNLISPNAAKYFNSAR